MGKPQNVNKPQRAWSNCSFCQTCEYNDRLQSNNNRCANCTHIVRLYVPMCARSRSPSQERGERR
eukprot:4863904-Pyramimonas_sp.AAC.1